MRSGWVFGLALAVSVAAVGSASAVEFGAPDFPNYMSRIGAVGCDWTYDSYTRACPTPELPPKPAPAAEPAKPAAKAKKPS